MNANMGVRRRWLVRGWLPAAALFQAVLGIGCTTGHVTGSRAAPTGLAPQDAFTVILEERPGAEWSAALEDKVAGCIGNALRAAHPAMRMVSADEFHQAAYPDLTQLYESPDNFSWARLVSDPTFQQRMAPLGLRYLIVVAVDEGKRTSRFNTDLDLRGGFAAWWEWDTFATMYANVLDITHGRVAGSLLAEARGKSGAGVAVFIILPIPFGWPSFPVGTACSKLGEGVATFLAGENLPER